MFQTPPPPLAPRRVFLGRLARSAAVFGLFIVGSLVAGVLGYHWLAHLGWIDAFLNASMILTGMGPVDPMPTDAAKIFASLYALFSGVAFLSSVGVLIAPVLHRVLHRLHLESSHTD
jgi:hypothetical protein